MVKHLTLSSYRDCPSSSIFPLLPTKSNSCEGCWVAVGQHLQTWFHCRRKAIYLTSPPQLEKSTTLSASPSMVRVARLPSVRHIATLRSSATHQVQSSLCVRVCGLTDISRWRQKPVQLPHTFSHLQTTGFPSYPKSIAPGLHMHWERPRGSKSNRLCLSSSGVRTTGTAPRMGNIGLSS